MARTKKCAGSRKKLALGSALGVNKRTFCSTYFNTYKYRYWVLCQQVDIYWYGSSVSCCLAHFVQATFCLVFGLFNPTCWFLSGMFVILLPCTSWNKICLQLCWCSSVCLSEPVIWKAKHYKPSHQWNSPRFTFLFSLSVSVLLSLFSWLCLSAFVSYRLSLFLPGG